MALEQCFACANERGRCFTERPMSLFDSRAAARGALFGAIVSFVVCGSVIWGAGLGGLLNGLFADAVDKKLRAI
jgi:hypothetical protein